jgi:hypothetical protein
MTIGALFAQAELVLEDVLADVIAKFDVASASTTFLVGEQHLHQNGAADVVVFVPAPSSISGAPQRQSARQGATIGETCTAYIWGVNADDDNGIGQFRAAKTLLVELVGALRLVAGGRVRFLEYSLADETLVLKYGEQYQFRFALDVPITMVTPAVRTEFDGITLTQTPRTP